MEIFNRVCNDPMPHIRKQASIVLNQLIKLIPSVNETELLNIFSRFYKDEQDNVRMQGIDSCVIFSHQMSANKIPYLLP